MNRIRIALLLGALAALATAFSACGGSSSSADPEEVIGNATLQGIESGKLDLSVDVNSKGEKSADLTISLSGPFQQQGKGDLPLLDMTVAAKGRVNGDDVDFKGGLTLLSDRAYVGYEGTEYEVDPTTFGFVKSSFEQAQQAPQEGADAGACQDAATGIDLGALIENPQNEGSADVEGEATTKISGDLDVGGAVDAVIGLAEDPACQSQLEAAGTLPLDQLDEAKGELTGAVKKAHGEIYVGDDGIIRRVVAELVVEPKGSGRVAVDLDLTISGINAEQEIAAPKGAKPLEDLFKKLGINPLELLEGGGGGIAGLLEGLIEDDGGSGSAGGGSSGSGSSGSGSSGGVNLDDQQAYLECLQEVETASDLQKCASLAP